MSKFRKSLKLLVSELNEEELVEEDVDPAVEVVAEVAVTVIAVLLCGDVES
jgi:hypothetical protein